MSEAVTETAHPPPVSVAERDPVSEGIRELLQQKIKKPRSPAQLESLRKATEKRKENLQMLSQQTKLSKKQKAIEAEKARTQQIIQAYEREREQALLLKRRERAEKRSQQVVRSPSPLSDTDEEGLLPEPEPMPKPRRRAQSARPRVSEKPERQASRTSEEAVVRVAFDGPDYLGIFG